MENGIVKPMLRSLLISYVLSGLLLGALAFALYKLRLKEGQVNLMVYLVYLAACLAAIEKEMKKVCKQQENVCAREGSSGDCCQDFFTFSSSSRSPGP